jgi:hypothetical protein
MSYAFSIAMHCVCLQSGRPKWMHAQDLKHRINDAWPNNIDFRCYTVKDESMHPFKKIPEIGKSKAKYAICRNS